MKRNDQFVVVYQGTSRVPTAVNLSHVITVAPAAAGEFGIRKVGDNQPLKCKREDCIDLLIAVGLERAKVGKTSI